MKALIAAIVLLAAGTPAVCRAEEVRPNPAVLRAIVANAQAAQADASIYQWKRVNRQVDRIVCDQRKLGSAATDSLATAIRALRAARLHHDVAAVRTAADAVLQAVKEMK